MKPEELRRGNLLKGGIVKSIEGGVLSFEDNRTLYGYSHPKAKPIPITEEWLLKLGFKSYSFMYEKKQYAVERFSTKGKIEWGIWFKGQRLATFKFVHQLQNLYFALTRTELKINK